LQNIQYTGTYVAGKTLKNHETGKKFHTSQSDWIIIPDKYPPIVSKELFDRVQENIKGDNAKRITRPRDYLLRGGIVKCGCCGYALAYDDSAAINMYRCYHTLADTSALCHKLKVNAEELDDVVLTIIRKQAEIILNCGNLSELRVVGTDGMRVADYENEIRECIEQRQQAYERFVLREIDREAHQALRNACTERLERLNNQIAVLKQAERDRQLSLKSADAAKHVLSETATPREIVETLIDKVFVSPGKKVKIRWKTAEF